VRGRVEVNVHGEKSVPCARTHTHHTTPIKQDRFVKGGGRGGGAAVRRTLCRFNNKKVHGRFCREVASNGRNSSGRLGGRKARGCADQGGQNCTTKTSMKIRFYCVKKN